MTLRAIHDFEVALLDPFIAMTERGIRIDEPRRAAMLADVTSAKAPLERDIGAYVVDTILPAHRAREGAFVQRAQGMRMLSEREGEARGVLELRGV